MSGCPGTSAQAYEDCGAPAQGLSRYPGFLTGSAIDAAIRSAVLQSKPSGAPSSYAVVCEAMLRAGGLIYYKSNPGDCGAPPAPGGITSGQVAGLSGSAASGVIGGLGAVGAISGVATLGITSAISFAVGGIESIFAHHEQAVANEQATICAVANYFNPAKKQIDDACRTGVISPDAASAYLTQVCNQAKTGLSSIAKVCNAAYVYQAICQAFINYAHTWYDTIAPTVGVYPQAPAAAPTAPGTPPGGVTVSPTSPAPAPPVRSQAGSTYAPAILTSAPPLNLNSSLPGNYGGVDYLNLGYNQQTGQSGQAADVPPTEGINWVAVGAVAAVIALVVSLSRR